MFYRAAVVFAIPGLTENWYVAVGDPTKTKNDPALLITGQTFALFFNLLAAVLLVLRISGHESSRFSHSCIVALFIAVILDLICLSVFGASHPNTLRDGYILSTAFYLTLASGIMSLTAALFMIVDAYKARARTDVVHLLTPKQRSLAMMGFHFMAYLAIGGIMYKFLLDLTYVIILRPPICSQTSPNDIELFQVP